MTSQTENQWAQPREVDDILFVFPANVSSKYLPEMDDIPKEFHSWNHLWCRFTSGWFFDGLSNFPKCKEGVNPKLAEKHAAVCLRSFEPQHEHKISGVAYLLSLWCELPEEG